MASHTLTRGHEGKTVDGRGREDSTKTVDSVRPLGASLATVSDSQYSANLLVVIVNMTRDGSGLPHRSVKFIVPPGTVQ